MVIEQRTGIIICIDFSNGKKHDFKLYQESNIQNIIPSTTKILADSGYQGIDKLHNNNQNNNNQTQIPIKESKLKKLTPEQKQQNRKLSKERIEIENVIGDVKTFKIHSERYRSRGKRFGLRMNLTCGLINYQRRLRS